jgi:hypothetical protein
LVGATAPSCEGANHQNRKEAAHAHELDFRQTATPFTLI